MMLDTIKNFVEGNMDTTAFFQILFSSQEMELAFMAETNLPKWTDAATLYDYLIAGDMSHSFLCAAKDLLGQYLKKHGISSIQDRQEEIEQHILLLALPDWLDLEPDYFQHILKNDQWSETEKIAAIKKAVFLEFKYLRSPPRWLQAPNWPFYNHKPLLFIGELEEGEEPGRSRAYVFRCDETGTYTVINQTD